MTTDEIRTRITLAIDGWIKARSIALHRDDRWTLIEALVAEFTKPPEPKEPQGVS